MDRRISQRARTDFGVSTRDGRLVSRCRGIEVSTTGLVLDRGRRLRSGDERVFLDLELFLPEHKRSIKARARPVWAFGSQQALKLLEISDVDRLDLAEHVDNMALRGQVLC